VELEFTALARAAAVGAAAPGPPPAADGDVSFDFGANVAPKEKEAVRYETVDTVQALERLVARARKVAAAGGTVAVDTETVIDPGAPLKVDALRSRLVSISVALAPGEAYYLPLAHREHRPEQTELLSGDGAAAASVDTDRLPTDAPPDGDADPDGAAAEEAPPAKKAKKKAAPKAPEPTGIAGRMLAERGYPVRNLPPLDAPEMRPLVALLEDAAVSKTLQNAKYDILALRRRRRRARGGRLRHDARQLRARPGAPVARARRAGARVPRPRDDVVRGAVRARGARSCRSTWCPWRRRATTRARTPT
jgi:DNA polymerase-1